MSIPRRPRPRHFSGRVRSGGTGTRTGLHEARQTGPEETPSRRASVIRPVSGINPEYVLNRLEVREHLLEFMHSPEIRLSPRLP